MTLTSSEREQVTTWTEDVVTIMNGKTFNSNSDYAAELRHVVSAYIEAAFIKGKQHSFK